MKRIITILVLAFACSSAFAQVAPISSAYSDLKGHYSPRNYMSSPNDPYSVFWAGLESLSVPGAGQLIMKEPGRGLSLIHI